MTPKEKWKRLQNPKSVHDYGLSITESELKTFEEGREILAEISEFTEKQCSYNRIFAEIGKNASRHLDIVRYVVIKNNLLDM